MSERMSDKQNMQTVEVKKRKSPSTVDDQDSHPSCSNNREMKNNDAILVSDAFEYTLFERIYSSILFPKMPDVSWAIHRSLLPAKTIIVSEVGAIGDNNMEIAPLYIKQIVFDPKMNFEVFFVNTRTVLKDKPSVPQTLEEFEDIVAYINNIRLCPGGPAVLEYSNVDLECAYKDPTEKWRHNLCSLETADESVCKSCFSLQEILQRHVQRNKLSGKTLPHSRKEKRKVGSRRAKRI